MFESIGLKIIERVEYGVSLGYQVVADAVQANNQSRAHSKNTASIKYNGLLLRSSIEVAFFRALFQAGYLVAPLPVFVHKPTYWRVEPGFVVVKYGIWAIVEIDGKPWHRETPAEAAKRLEPFTHENAIVSRPIK